MTKLLRVLISALAALSFCQAASAARPSKPMDTFENIPFETSGAKKLSRAQIQTGIMNAGMDHGWVIKPNADGTLAAHLDVRKHSVDATITFDTNKYSILYKDSKNLGYAVNPDDPKRPLIHPSYNKWVATLISDIKKEFLRR